MKQNLQAKMPLLCSVIINPDDVLEDELVEFLKKKGKFAPMNMTKKKEFMNRLLQFKSDLKANGLAYDALHSTALSEGIKNILPDTKSDISRMSNDDLSKLVAQILPILQSIRIFLLDQHKHETQAKNISLRTSTNQQKLQNPILGVLESSDDLFRKLKDGVIAIKTEASFGGVKAVTLTPAQIQRSWDQSRVSKQNHLQHCPKCGHKSTNVPIENDGIQAYNKEKAEEYKTDIQLWDAYQQRLNKGEQNARKPRHLSRRPYRMREPKAPIIQCMCMKSYCLGAFEDGTKTCPIRCLQDSNDISSRYEFTGTGRKSCSCPICKCRCNYACRISDVAKIMLAKTTAGEGKEEEAISSGSGYSTSTSSFLNNIWGNALSVGFDTYEHQKFKSGKNNEEQHVRDYAMAAASHKAATDIMKTSQKLSVKEKTAWREGFGNPTTKCRLPSGDGFDTRCIAGRNRHSINNKLGVREKAEIFPGMKSNLKIDFSNKSEAYQNFIGVEATKNSKDCTVKIELSSSNDSSIIEVIEAPKKKQVFSYVENMHARVMTRARGAISRSIEDRMKSDDDEKRKTTKQLKKTVQMLESSEKNNTHLNTIRNVTDNGSLILSSQDVLDRIKLYHDTD